MKSELHRTLLACESVSGRALFRPPFLDTVWMTTRTSYAIAVFGGLACGAAELLFRLDQALTRLVQAFH